MSIGPLADSLVRESMFRANPRYELVRYENMTQHHQNMFLELSSDDEFYGVLRPLEGSLLTIKAVDNNTALLFLSMHDPSRLSRTILRKHDDLASIARLVIDGVLEIESRGAFVSGPSALTLLYPQQKELDNRTSGNILSTLSIQSLIYAQSLSTVDIQHLSGKLYWYNRIPVSDYWRRTFNGKDRIEMELGIEPGGVNHQILTSNWKLTGGLPRYGWITFRNSSEQLIRTENGVTYKMYVSPHPRHIRQVFHCFLKVCTDHSVPQFKFGDSVYGLLRPDKFVAYFDSFEHLSDVAKELDFSTNSFDAHGVPFTAQLSGNSMLSWGMDPPRKARQVLGWQEKQSWRLWITNRLAAALAMAMQSPATDQEPWKQALLRLEHDGIDTTTWMPRDGLWGQIL